MIDAEKRKAIFLLHQEGMGLRRIASSLNVTRNTVRKIIGQQGRMPDTVRRDKIRIDEELLRRLYEKCEGYIQRVHEKLQEEEGIRVSYPTVTRLVRELGIGGTRRDRCDEAPDVPGAEMQHDTTTYHVMIADRRTLVTASLLYLRYSKRRYLKFYRAFNRFKMKCFFHEALVFWGYAASACIIDNTNLARLRGTGKQAVIAPEMKAFGAQYGFEFVCHEKGCANRKAGEEKALHTVQTNFLPGRDFQSMRDMNARFWGRILKIEKIAVSSYILGARLSEISIFQMRPHLPPLPSDGLASPKIPVCPPP